MKNKKIFLEKLRTEVLKLDQSKYKIEDLLKGLNIDELKYDRLIKEITLKSLSLTSASLPSWDSVSSFIYAYNLVGSVVDRRGYEYGDMARLLVDLTSKGIYGEYLLEHSFDLIEKVEKLIDKKNDRLFSYAGIKLLSERYLAFDSERNTYELPQERFMIIALHLSLAEKEENRYEFIKELYWALSNLKSTVATPTFANSGKPHFQLSSCFVDTVNDSLDEIYESLSMYGQISKYGGGIGTYIGKIRGNGSDIRGVKNSSAGVIPWMKLMNDTAIAVNQLGVRNGSISTYLDIWHTDIMQFMDVKTNSGDDSLKTHELFPALSIPDLFWRKAKDYKNEKFWLFCPHQIKKHMGYSLEDFYGDEWEKRYYECVSNKELPRKEVAMEDLIRLFLKAVLETGSMFVFNRDIANHYNPNNHCGMVYSSNLCTEIIQNQSPFKVGEVKSENGKITKEFESGDLVVCNLASLTLGNIDVDGKELERVTSIMIRAMDNVIDLNFYPIPQAEITNKKYRAVGLGTSGYNVLLANKEMIMEQKEAEEVTSKVYEDINYYAIKTSMNIAKAKGKYSMFEDSDWDNGDYFEKRDYKSQRWNDLREDIKKYGIRNGYLMAIAPTGSTSILANSSEGIDPIKNIFYLSEKKGQIVSMLAPKLEQNKGYYLPAYACDQEQMIKLAGLRQRHLDQSQSFNLFISPKEYSMKDVLDLYIKCWDNGLKSVYYCRTETVETTDCESCSA